MRTAALPLAPAILDMLPDDPAVIDQALSELSYSILAMRSDDAPAASIAIEGPSRELHPGDE
ncbi:MAG TPA: hypothetical protein VKG78_03270, partial [Opitutaceae bacterium]|nr:hypothetical protein [Opitutaceae bacterium]